MSSVQYVEQFTQAARTIGAEVGAFDRLEDAVEYIAQRVKGPLLLPAFSSGERHQLVTVLKKAGLELVVDVNRDTAAQALAGLTGVNFALADTGTLVLDSTVEEVRLATTLPEVHFALLDPEKILADSLEAVAPLRELHVRSPRNYIAYISGPSRTADIERVLTIGVHGPKQLHILLVPGLSNDLLEL